MGTWRRSLSTWLQSGSAEPGVAAAGANLRQSLALGELVPVLAEAKRPAVLDLGCVWQSTVAFFTGAGCKIYTEDVFDRLSQPLVENSPEAPPLRERFLAGLLQYPEPSFRAILVWDLFDYLPEELVEPLAARLHALLEPGGGLFLLFHHRLEEIHFTRYRVTDSRNFELLPGSLPLRPQRVYAQRTLLNLFAAFRSSRTFIGRDNLRELFLLK